MIVDAHQHYWDPARGDYGWLEPGSALDRRWMPGDLRPIREATGVSGTVLVQAAPTMAETDWLLKLAAGESSVRGVVGWVDLDAPGITNRLAERRGRSLVGVRPMLQDLADPEWILDTARTRGLKAVAAAGLAFDALVRPAGLPAIVALADRHPDLRIVLDHAGKPPLGDAAAMAVWEADLRRLAERPGTVCKLSGLMTEAPQHGRERVVREVMARLLDIWGPGRLLWGSDWPVLTLAVDYEGWLALASDMLCGLTEEERAAVFGGNAIKVYGL